jgi:hypothetical protein
LDALLQVVRELEGFSKLEDIVPPELLWDRPPGLPSGAELLWLVHLVDGYVFMPAAESIALHAPVEPKAPDYSALLESNPCAADNIDGLLSATRKSRVALVDLMGSFAFDPEIPERATLSLAEIILVHDRQILSAFTERLYESGLGS